MDFKNKKIMIIGAGLSGMAAARLLSGCGASDIILYDDNSAIDKASLRTKLPGEFTGRIETVDIPADCREKLDYLVLSPGVPRDLPFVTLMQRKGTVVLGEVELAYNFSKGRIIAITGTNGKTTTTALAGEIMRTFFESVFVVGNIGTPYTDMVSQTTDSSVTVAEMSSFQLDTIVDFRPGVSIILNITPDHLDRHHTMKNYIDAKRNIMRNQTGKDLCILNYEDAILRELGETAKNRVMWFSSQRKLEEGMYLDGTDIIYNDGVMERKICSTEDMQLIGKHNYENAMAAAAASIYMGVPYDLIGAAICAFKPVEHRIEYVATKKGVKYYNDSKGTNPDASIQAVKAMTAKTVLIGGGYDKNSDYDEWIKSFDGKIKLLILMGATREKIASSAIRLGFNSIAFVDSMEEAVALAAEKACEGETVLLSPCCASWGMFKNYEERGRIFKELVRNL